jgi:hypothetical protein
MDARLLQLFCSLTLFLTLLLLFRFACFALLLSVRHEFQTDTFARSMKLETLISPADIAGQDFFRRPSRFAPTAKPECSRLMAERLCWQPSALRTQKRVLWRYRAAAWHRASLTRNLLRLRKRLHSSAQQHAQRPMRALRLARTLHSILLEA